MLVVEGSGPAYALSMIHWILLGPESEMNDPYIISLTQPFGASMDHMHSTAPAIISKLLVFTIEPGASFKVAIRSVPSGVRQAMAEREHEFFLSGILKS